MKVNRDIRAPKVRVIGNNGEQIGIISIQEAMAMASAQGLDLVEIVPGSTPPVCKIMNFGKFRYDQSKREKESRKSQHQVKVKEIKFKPNIDTHDFDTKAKHAREFLLEGNKVKITCTFRGREMAHPEFGEKLIQKMCQQLEDVSTVEAPPKLLGRQLIGVLAPGAKKKQVKSTSTEQVKPPSTDQVKPST